MNILFISIAFPPKNDPESLQAAKYFKYLSRLNCKIDIVTSAIPTLYMPEDENLKIFLKNYRQFIEIPIKENKHLNYIIRKIFPKHLENPDSKFSFFTQWKKVVNSIQNKPDIIYTRSFPLSSAFMGEKLANHYKVPWILHLSDLWADCPINNFSGSAKTFHELKEKYFFNKANYICVTSQETLNYYKTKYPIIAHKFQFHPNVFDPEDITETNYEIGNTLKFVYTGGLTEKRSPQYFLDAIYSIYKEESKILDNVEFIFAGQFDRQNEKCLASYNLPMVKNLGLLRYSEAKKLQKDADILLIIDTPFDSNHSAMFFPSKILDYIIARKRMLALTNKGSTTYNIVNGIYGDCIEHNDVQEIIKNIKYVIAQHKEKNKSYFYQEKIDFSYSAEYNALKLEKLMHSLLIKQSSTQ